MEQVDEKKSTNQEMPHDVYDNEIKVVFLGNGGVGKSYIISRLMNDGHAPISYVEQSSEGVVINSKVYNLNNQHVKVNFWDFDEHMICYCMHRLFLTQRTIYVIVFDSSNDTQEKDVYYWLNEIKCYAPNAPVILAFNKNDLNQNINIDYYSLRKNYPNLKRSIKMSARDMSNVLFQQGFTEALLEEISRSGFLNDSLPSNWIRMKLELEQLSSCYINKSEFLEICCKYGMSPNNDDLLHQFNELGFIFYYSIPEDFVLKEDYIIIKLKWISNALCSLLFELSKLYAKKDNGLIDNSMIYSLMYDTEENWTPCYGPTNVQYSFRDIQYIIKIMRIFKISFPVNDREEFIPLLSTCQSKPIVDEYKQYETAVEFCMAFDYLPNSLIHRLMVGRYRELDIDNVWRTGARFRSDELGFSAVIEADSNKLRIFLFNDNFRQDSSVYLLLLKADVERICREMSIEFPTNWIVYKSDEKREAFQYEELMTKMDAGYFAVYSRVFRRMIPILDILPDGYIRVEKSRDMLLSTVAKACMTVQRNSGFWNRKEIAITNIIRESLTDKGYFVKIQTGNSSRVTQQEIDLIVCKADNQAWAACEFLTIKAKSDIHEWNNHLAKMLTNYNSRDIPIQFLVTFVECDLYAYQNLWPFYNEHMRRYDPKHGKCVGEYRHVLPLMEIPEGLRIACTIYDIGGTSVMVYHYFVHINRKEVTYYVVDLQDKNKITNIVNQRLKQGQGILIPNDENQTSSLQSELSQPQEVDENPRKLQLKSQKELIHAPKENVVQITNLEQELSNIKNQNVVEALKDNDEEILEDSIYAKMEYRVIILGDSEAGKSQILHRLRYPEKTPDSFSGDVTEGIDIASKNFIIGNVPVRINFWDFGGQEILHSLHRLFLTKNTMYVIVLNTRNDNQDEQAKYWLHYIELYATGAPVILVLNKIDQNPSAFLNMPVLERLFKYTAKIIDVLPLSARDWSKEKFQQEFVDKLRYHIGTIIDETNTFTEEELRIRDQILTKNKGHQIVEMSEFRKICSKANLPEGSNVNKLAERFHRAGMLVYFGTRTGMIMNPEWITNVIYKILNKGSSYASNGIIDYETIENILYDDKKEEYAKSHVDFVMKIMRKYGLSFQYQAQSDDFPEQEFIPVLCKRGEPSLVKQFISKKDVIQMQMIFRYLPAGVLYQLMVDLKSEICNENVWLSGAMFKNGSGCTAVVTREKDRMIIYTHGENRVLTLRYMESIKERVEGIARSDMYNAYLLEILLGYYIADRGEVEFFDYDRLSWCKELNLNYVMSKCKPGALIVRDILDQRDGDQVQERDTLLNLVLTGCMAIQKDKIFWNQDENAKNRELARIIQTAFIAKDQTQGGDSGTGIGFGELDIEILNQNGEPIAILEALNTSSINTSNWREHLNKLMDNYNTSGLRYLILTSYVKCSKSTFKDRFSQTAEHWQNLEVKGFEGCFEGVDTVMMKECPELIRITRADYIRNNFKVSLFHFMVHVGGDSD